MRHAQSPQTQRRNRLRPARLLPGALLLLAAACRESAPDDLIQHEETTDALVFVKTDGEETLNRTWADGNLYKLSPIAPDGVVTPITNFTGASHLRPVRVVRRQEDPVLDARSRHVESQHLRDRRRRHRAAPGHERRRPRLRPALPARRPHPVHQLARRRDGRVQPRAGRAPVHVQRGRQRTSSASASTRATTSIPSCLPDGRIVYTRWEHFGTMNRFPLFFTNPDGTGTFHLYGPHGRNFFHAQADCPTAASSRSSRPMIEEDAGPIAVLKLEQGPADPVIAAALATTGTCSPRR